MTNCVNCGAPLPMGTGIRKCKYCGTEYQGNAVVAEFTESTTFGTLNVGGKEYPVYLSRMECESIYIDAGRDMYGRFQASHPILKHKFTLIER